MSRTLTTSAPLTAALLPAQLTGFVGREHEVSTLRRLITGSRLLTLTGAGGSGKTRLALETVTRMQAAAEAEVAWVELAALGDAGSLADHLALALGVRSEGGGSTEQALVAMLRERSLLLVLDNCEHLVEECARIVEFLLRACPGLRVLATSREALGITGERSWLVPALSLPADGAALTPDEALRSESVQLFVERAQDVLPTFALTSANVGAVARICRRVDGLPLAVELAASRVAVLAPEEIAARLGDRFALLGSGARSAVPRHRTLRAAVDWSYDLLPEPERMLLERLSVFAGGFTLDAAEQVCAGGAIPESRVLDLLAALTMRSLVAMQEDEGRARYRLLETIREYALARRAERPDVTGIAERHARYFRMLAQELEPDLILGRAHRLRQMDVEHDNVRAALAWSAEHGEGADHGLPLGWALVWYWFHRQLWREGFGHLETALATAVEPAPELRAAALHGLGLFGLYVGDAQSRARLAEAERLWRTVGNRRWLAFTLLVRTVESSLRREPAEARAFAEEAVAVARTLSDPWDAALAAAHALVPVLLWERDWQTAEQLLAGAERVFRERRYEIGVAYVLDARAFVMFQLGDLSGAEALARASLREEPQGENRWLAGRSLRVLGAVAFARGVSDRAARLYGAAAGMYEAIGAHALTAERGAVNEVPEHLRAAMPADAFEAEWEAGRALPFDAALALALADAPADAPTDVRPASPGEPREVPAPAALTVRALGALEIRRAGVPVPPDAWRYAKPRELLLYLLSHPEGRTREQVGLDFWPEISAAQVKNNFHVTLHHLRKALGGAEWIRFERGRYRVATEAGVTFDAAEFEARTTDALRQLKARPADADAASALHEALALHRGGFLDGEPAGDWHLGLRDRLARLYEDGLSALAAFHERQGDHTRAAEVLRRLLAVDDVHEEVARRLMLALAASGRRSDAVRVHDELVRRLRVELESEPAAETRQLADRIRRGAAP
jgi:predicted ATPase/DNA-binding SARP family transcriptional activator